VETLQRLTRRQLEALRFIAAHEPEGRGLGLNAIADGLGVRAPSALEHLGPLEELGLITRFRGKSQVTRRGLACLEEYLRHHRVAESLFARAGLSADATHVAALEVDLALSHRTVQEICEGEGHPKVCPHGEPIAPCEPSTGKRAEGGGARSSRGRGSPGALRSGTGPTSAADLTRLVEN
jgi:Mn-dependent DtxR family transcriptional regulator